jgi:hypothetical protein
MQAGNLGKVGVAQDIVSSSESENSIHFQLGAFYRIAATAVKPI